MTAFATVFSLVTTSLSPVPTPVVQTRTATTSSFSPIPEQVVQTRTVTTDVHPVTTPAYRQGWDRVVDDLFIPWANGQIEVDDDLMPPTPESLRTSIALAYKFRDEGRMPPTDVLPSGNGGIWLENRHGTSSVQIEVLRDGSLEISTFEGGNFVRAVPVPASIFVTG